MTDCKECKYPDLCKAFRAPEEHIAPDGKLREIIGCTVDKIIFGEELK